MTKRFGALALAILVAAGLATAVATPAQANYDNCDNRVCLYDDINGGSFLYGVYAGPGTCVNIPSPVNDRADSFYNALFTSARHAQFYQNANCTGHAMHDTTGFGGTTQPFPAGRLGTFIRDLSHISCHCDRNKVTSIFFNTG